MVNPRLSIKQFDDYKFIIGVDTYDKDISIYQLYKLHNNKLEVLLSKRIRNKDNFYDEVKNLSKYFNAKIYTND